jgi:hypothetical protein
LGFWLSAIWSCIPPIARLLGVPAPAEPTQMLPSVVPRGGAGRAIRSTRNAFAGPLFTGAAKFAALTGFV